MDAASNLVFRPLTPELMDAMGQALRGSWGLTCWCMYPRLTDAHFRDLPGEGRVGDRRRAAMTELAATRAPGLLAFEDGARRAGSPSPHERNCCALTAPGPPRPSTTRRFG